MSIIEVKNLSKVYNITAYTNKDKITERIASFVNCFKADKTKKYFFALNNINLKIKSGSIVGIIGANGAGKSTLLKVLSKITYPSEGEVVIKGKVASLLEVGTGFNPELSGKENIFLSGSILGMTRKEIQKRFKDIVDFAEIGDFINIPIKKYSSGMQIRLAFSVAAHLDSEILLIDEVLAVGDINFQKKCLSKMNKITSHKNRTILFVSHNLAAIENICDQCILLNQGKVSLVGETEKVIKKYLDECMERNTGLFKERKDRQGNGKVKIVDLEILDEAEIKIGKELKINIHYQMKSTFGAITSVGLSIWTKHDVRLISVATNICQKNLNNFPNTGVAQCIMPKLPLINGEYFINPSIYVDFALSDYITHAKKISVHGSDFYQTGKLPNSDWGLVAVDCNWDIIEK